MTEISWTPDFVRTLLARPPVLRFVQAILAEGPVGWHREVYAAFSDILRWNGNWTDTRQFFDGVYCTVTPPAMPYCNTTAPGYQLGVWYAHDPSSFYEDDNAPLA